MSKFALIASALAIASSAPLMAAGNAHTLATISTFSKNASNSAAFSRSSQPEENTSKMGGAENFLAIPLMLVLVIGLFALVASGGDEDLPTSP